MNTQELFDKAVGGVIAQGALSLDENDNECMYRYGKLKCAVGHLISDEEYAEVLEGTAFSDGIIVIAAVTKSIGRTLSTREFTLLESLQHIHDHADNAADFAAKAKDAGERRGLAWNFGEVA